MMILILHWSAGNEDRYRPVVKTGYRDIILMSVRSRKMNKLLNQWDTACGADKDFRFYQVEAEEIAQKTRKNSTLETVA